MEPIMALIIGIILSFFFFAVLLYNRLVGLSSRCDAAWSDIDVQLKRRHDLVPNLVETVKGYAHHEQETLDKVIRARNAALATTGVDGKAQAEQLLSSAIKGVFVLAEAYPALRANEHFLSLQKNLSEVEDHLQMSRRYYNGTVRDMNVACETFPSLIVANAFRFSKREFFQVEASERENAAVQFS